MRSPIHSLPLLLIWVALYADARRLNGWDAWATVSACQQVSVTTGKSDSNGRLWGYENGASCAFKDEQQQALYANQATPLQDFGTARMCGEQPNQYNSQPDSVGRLWGVWWGNSCAFRTDAGAPVYYTGYTGKRYSSSSSPPKQSPSPASPMPQPAFKAAPAASSSPATTTSAVTALPTPVATSSPAAPAISLPPVANPAVSPLPAPAAKVLPTAVPPPPTAATSDSTCPCGAASATPVIILNATAVAEAVAQRLWRMFSDYTNGYEMTISEAPNTNSTAINATHATLNPFHPPAQSPAAQRTQVAALLASLLSAAPPQQNNTHSPLATLQSALVAGAQHPAASSAIASLSGVSGASSAATGSNGVPLPTKAGGPTLIMNTTNSSRTNVGSSPASHSSANNNSSALPATVSITSWTGTLPSSQGGGSMTQAPAPAMPAKGAATAGPAAVATGPFPTGSPAPVQQTPTTIDTFSPGGPFLTVPGDESASPNASAVNSSTSSHAVTPVLSSVHNVTRRRLLAFELMAYALQATPIRAKAATTRALLQTQTSDPTYTVAGTDISNAQQIGSHKGPDSTNSSAMSFEPQAETSLDCWVEEHGNYQDLTQVVKCAKRGSNILGGPSQAVHGQQPADSQLTWQSAPACKHAATRTNSVADSSGMLWGWDETFQRSCAFKDPTFYETAQVCREAVSSATTVRDRDGRLWGWQDGASCRY